MLGGTATAPQAQNNVEASIILRQASPCVNPWITLLLPVDGTAAALTRPEVVCSETEEVFVSVRGLLVHGFLCCDCSSLCHDGR